MSDYIQINYYREAIVVPSCSDFDIKKYSEQLNNILTETRDRVKGVKAGYSTRIDNSRFGRTGYHDENEWNTYKAILYLENIYVTRMSHTGIDSSIGVAII
jgi:hypothetical protein